MPKRPTGWGQVDLGALRCAIWLRRGGRVPLFVLRVVGRQAAQHNQRRLQEREECVGGTGICRVRIPVGAVRVDCLFLELGVGVLVDVGGLDALVSEPECDCGDVDALGSERASRWCGGGRAG